MIVTGTVNDRCLWRVCLLSEDHWWHSFWPAHSLQTGSAGRPFLEDRELAAGSLPACFMRDRVSCTGMVLVKGDRAFGDALFDPLGAEFAGVRSRAATGRFSAR